MNKKEFLEFEKEMREVIKSQKEVKREVSSVVKLDVPNWDVSCGYSVYGIDFIIEIEWCEDWDKEGELKKYIKYLVDQHCIPVNHLKTEGEIEWNKDHIVLDYGMCLEVPKDPRKDCKYTDQVFIKIKNPKKKTSKKK